MKSWKKFLGIILIIILINVNLFALAHEREDFYLFYSKDSIVFKYNDGFIFSIINVKDKNVINQIQNSSKLISISNTDNTVQIIKRIIDSNGKCFVLCFNKENNLGYLYYFDNTLKGKFAYYSNNTKRLGIITQGDIISILKGENISLKKISDNEYKHLLKMYNNFNKTYRYQLYYFLPSIILQGIVTLLLFLLIIGVNIKLNLKYKKSLLLFCCVSFIYQLLMPLFSIINTKYHILISLIMIIFLIFLSLYLSKFDLKKTLIIASSISIVIIISQALFFNNWLQLNSIIGYHIAYANRFYGLGNEFFSFLVANVTMIFVVLSNNHTLKNVIYLGVLIILALMLCVPFYFINFGAFLSIAISILLYLFLTYKKNTKLILVVSIMFSGMLFYLVKKNEYVHNALFSKGENLVNIINRKISMNLSYFFNYPAVILIFIAFLYLFWLVKGDSFYKNKYISTSNIRLFTLYLNICIFSFLLNDSGTIILTFLTMWLIYFLFFLQLVKGNGKGNIREY